VAKTGKAAAAAPGARRLRIPLIGGVRAPRPGRGTRRTDWVPVAGYVTFVLVAGAAIFAWDRAYEARRQALYRPVSPPVLVRNMIESIVGAGTVSNVKIDDKANTLDVTVKDVLIKPSQPLAEKKKNLSTEGALAIQFVASRLRFKTMSVHLVRNGKVLATVRAAGQAAPTTEYAPDLR
jgi:hypothetical protein